MEIDDTPVLAEALERLARAWAVLHPAASIDERRALAARIGWELAGSSDTE